MPLVGLTPPIVYPIAFWVDASVARSRGRAARPRLAESARDRVSAAGLDRGDRSSASRSSAVSARHLLAGEPRSFDAGRGDFFYLADALPPRPHVAGRSSPARTT